MVFRRLGLFCLAFLLASADAPAASDPPEQRSPAVEGEAHHDVSPPLFLIPPAPRQPSGPIIHEVKPIPRPGRKLRVEPESLSAAASPAPEMPSTGTNVDGIGLGYQGPSGTFSIDGVPPDPMGDIGPNHYVTVVNSDFAVLNKSGVPIYGPVPTNTLWNGFGGLCQSDDDGDAIVLYDPMADRWVISQFAVSGANGTFAPFLECVAVSQTADPTGAYYRYSFSYSGYPDYPKMGVWPDAYFETFDMFNASGNLFRGGKVCAYDRARMLTGATATQQCFDVGQSFGGLLPADLDGATPPPAGAPNYVLALGAAANQLAFWKFHVDWVTPASSTLTGPTTLATAPFTDACSTTGICIPQSGTTQTLDALGDRVMFRLAYRNFGDHESLVANHSITNGSSTAIRWYEIRTPGTTPTIYQQGTYAPDSSHRWMGSIAMDRDGDIALGFSVSSPVLHPEIHYTGRLSGDPAGQMPQGEAVLINGGGSQAKPVNRWGDYSMMAVDPSDDCTFWYVNEYLRSSVGTFNWSTRIGSFKFPACGMLQPPKPVPDGRYVAGALMRASRNGNGVDLTWDTSTCSSPAYNLYYGAIGSFAAIAGAICGLPPGGSAANLAIPDDSFWVVAGANASEVSSFGRDGAGAEEDFTGWPGRCAQATQVTSATCP